MVFQFQLLIKYISFSSFTTQKVFVFGIFLVRKFPAVGLNTEIFKMCDHFGTLCIKGLRYKLRVTYTE